MNLFLAEVVVFHDIWGQKNNPFIAQQLKKIVTLTRQSIQYIKTRMQEEHAGSFFN